MRLSLTFLLTLCANFRNPSLHEKGHLTYHKLLLINFPSFYFTPRIWIIIRDFTEKHICLPHRSNYTVFPQQSLHPVGSLLWEILTYIRIFWNFSRLSKISRNNYVRLIRTRCKYLDKVESKNHRVLLQKRQHIINDAWYWVWRQLKENQQTESYKGLDYSHKMNLLHV